MAAGRARLVLLLGRGRAGRLARGQPGGRHQPRTAQHAHHEFERALGDRFRARHAAHHVRHARRPAPHGAPAGGRRHARHRRGLLWPQVRRQQHPARRLSRPPRAGSRPGPCGRPRRLAARRRRAAAAERGRRGALLRPPGTCAGPLCSCRRALPRAVGRRLPATARAGPRCLLAGRGCRVCARLLPWRCHVRARVCTRRLRRVRSAAVLGRGGRLWREGVVTGSSGAPPAARRAPAGPLACRVRRGVRAARPLVALGGPRAAAPRAPPLLATRWPAWQRALARPAVCMRRLRAGRRGEAVAVRGRRPLVALGLGRLQRARCRGRAGRAGLRGAALFGLTCGAQLPRSG